MFKIPETYRDIHDNLIIASFVNINRLGRL